MERVKMPFSVKGVEAWWMNGGSLAMPYYINDPDILKIPCGPGTEIKNDENVLFCH